MYALTTIVAIALGLSILYCFPVGNELHLVTPMAAEKTLPSLSELTVSLVPRNIVHSFAEAMSSTSSFLRLSLAFA
jgi:Na+/H+-dicarboxylate symporter